MCLVKSSFNRARIITGVEHCLKKSILKGVVKQETDEQNKTEYQGIELQLERWLGDEWMFDSMYLYTFYC